MCVCVCVFVPTQYIYIYTHTYVYINKTFEKGVRFESSHTPLGLRAQALHRVELQQAEYKTLYIHTHVCYWFLRDEYVWCSYAHQPLYSDVTNSSTITSLTPSTPLL